MTDDVTQEVDVKSNVPTRIGGDKGIAPGRKKGSKNKSTLLREALVHGFEEELERDFIKVVRIVMEQAIEGDRQSQKLILDRVVPTVHAASDKDANPFSGGINITIGSLESQKSISISADIEDAEYETIEDS